MPTTTKTVLPTGEPHNNLVITSASIDVPATCWRSRIAHGVDEFTDPSLTCDAAGRSEFRRRRDFGQHCRDSRLSAASYTRPEWIRTSDNHCSLGSDVDLSREQRWRFASDACDVGEQGTWVYGLALDLET
jgi:hypothetical protein